MTSAVLPKPVTEPAPETSTGPKPLTEGKQPIGILIGLWGFVVIPFIALVAAIPIAWRYGSLTWTIVAIGAVFYTISGLGITVGFHRYFTHGSFKAKRGLRIALAIAGSMAIQGEPTQWVADHRRHHSFSDLEGDPHSPWRFGTSLRRAGQGPLVRAHGLAVPPRAVQPGPVRTRPRRRPRYAAH